MIFILPMFNSFFNLGLEIAFVSFWKFSNSVIILSYLFSETSVVQVLAIYHILHISCAFCILNFFPHILVLIIFIDLYFSFLISFSVSDMPLTLFIIEFLFSAIVLYRFHLPDESLHLVIYLTVNIIQNHFKIYFW